MKLSFLLFLLDIAEKYYYCSEKHYLTAIVKALEDLYTCLTSPFLSKISSYRACEGAGRGTLLVARYYHYNEMKSESEIAQLLKDAGQYLESALSYIPSIDKSISSKIVRNSTVLYDLARVNSLLQNQSDTEKYLKEASREIAIPPLSVYFIEPDFNFSRDSAWFTSLGSLNDTDTQSVLKKALISMGFSLTSKNDTLRFPLCKHLKYIIYFEYSNII